MSGLHEECWCGLGVKWEQDMVYNVQFTKKF